MLTVEFYVIHGISSLYTSSNVSDELMDFAESLYKENYIDFNQSDPSSDSLEFQRTPSGNALFKKLLELHERYKDKKNIEITSSLWADHQGKSFTELTDALKHQIDNNSPIFSSPKSSEDAYNVLSQLKVQELHDTYLLLAKRINLLGHNEIYDLELPNIRSLIKKVNRNHKDASPFNRWLRLICGILIYGHSQKVYSFDNTTTIEAYEARLKEVDAKN